MKLPLAPFAVAVLLPSLLAAQTAPRTSPPQPSNPPASTQQNLPNAPTAPPPPVEPSLGDLGFPQQATQGNAAQQALLDRRSHMLQIHQRLGLITTIPLVATLFSGSFAGSHHNANGVTTGNSATGRNIHAALGGATVGLYAATAYFAIKAPKIPGAGPTRGPIRLHKALALIHGPGMVLTPILGILAYKQESDGEKVHGIASAHVPIAAVTAAAYGAAILSVSIKWPHH